MSPRSEEFMDQAKRSIAYVVPDAFDEKLDA